MTEQFPEPEIVDRPEQHLAVVRDVIAFEAIPALYDRAYPAIFGALQRAGVAPAAAPMGVMHGRPGAELDLSVAVPVAEPFGAGADDGDDSDGEVRSETLPAQRAATLLVTGDYTRLAAGYAHLFDWIAEQGLAPTDVSWEQYLTEPQPGGDPALNETLIGVYLQD